MKLKIRQSSVQLCLAGAWTELGKNVIDHFVSRGGDGGSRQVKKRITQLLNAPYHGKESDLCLEFDDTYVEYR